MKKINYIKKSLLSVAFLTTIFLITSCDFSQKLNDPKVTAVEQNDDRYDNKKQENDAEFLVNATKINLEQMQLGQLAQQNGGTAEVKKLGEKMEDVHSKSLHDLTALAKSKIITIPTSSTVNAREAYADLNEKSGKDFDKAYANLMVSEHKDAIDDFEDASINSNDQDIKNWATVSLPGLRTNLNSAVELQNNLTAYNSQNK